MKKKYLHLWGILFLLSTSIIGCTDEAAIDPPLTRSKVTRAGETIFQNQTITTDRTVTGTDIIATNITVKNGASLTLDGSNSVTINQPFTVDAGCELTITH
ncbi:hypothetical protein HF895_12050 [Bacteroides sp. AN502]|nr:hypothetical protein [Caecibacteroides pullorum]